MLHVGDDVGRVREEDEPERRAGDERKTGRAAPEAVVDDERERERDPGEEEVPDQRAVVEVAADDDPKPIIA